VWILFNRIDFHVMPGNKLEKIKWFREGHQRIEGQAQLPSLQPLNIAVDSAIFPGAARVGNNAPPKKNSPLFNTIVVSFGLAVDTKHGFVQRDPNNPKQRPGYLDWAAIIMDAMETDIDGTIDAGLNSSCSKPMTYQLREPDPTELAFSAVLDVILTSDGFYRGERCAKVGPRPD
jgi:hypothetical protein